MKESEKKGKKGKYKVKLSNRNKNEKTVDGITITQEWKRVKEKTNELELLEKKGEIIIEEVEDPETAGKLKFTIEIDDQGAPIIKDSQGNIQKRTGAVESGTGKMSKGFSSEWASMASLMRWHPEAARIPKFTIEIDKGKAIVKDTQGNIQKLTGAGTIRKQEIQRILSLQSAPSNTPITEENLRKIVEELLNKKFDVKVEGTIKDRTETPKAEEKFEKMRWLGNYDQLKYFIQWLISWLSKKYEIYKAKHPAENINLRVPDFYWKWAFNCFSNKYGEPLENFLINKICMDSKDNRIEKLRWFGSNVQLAYLIKWFADKCSFKKDKDFVKENLIPKNSNYWKWAGSFFRDKHEDKFKKNALAMSYYRYMEHPDRLDNIHSESIMEILPFANPPFFHSEVLQKSIISVILRYFFSGKKLL